ncbi:MAG: cation transporter [Bacteroidetes bacterium]|nr:cation transporter [Bacteroidota bacterium]
MTQNERQLYSTALLLSLFTIFYNVLEGVACTWLGYEDETLTLFGFGIDSFIEVISGLGIFQMILRIRQHPETAAGKFEIRALRITGYSFYVLAVGLAAGIIVNLLQHHKPESTFWGTVISSISIVVMIWLVISKKRVGKKLGSAAILADANCSLVCIYMSLVLLVASAVYQFTGFAYADVIGSAGLIYFSVNEGKEALEKARKGNYLACSCSHESD